MNPQASETSAAAQTNPYQPVLGQLVEQAIVATPAGLAKAQRASGMAHWDADNEWVHVHLASWMMAAAAAWARPGTQWHQSEQALSFVRDALRRLIDAAADDRWYHLQPRKGDRNIDRFTLLPVIETYRWTHEALADDLGEAARRTIARVLAVQAREYPQLNGEQLYPNMDVYFCLLMLHGKDLFAQPNWAALYERYLERLEAAQFPSGAWTYIAGTNECPMYHDINVVLCARIEQLTGTGRAQAMIQRSADYYPSIVAPTGVPEYYTDCWWKHCWSPQPAFGPDVVASVVGDGRNRAIADHLRHATAHQLLTRATAQAPMALPWLVYALDTYQPVESAAWAQVGMRYDSNIQGPRGCFDRWSWAATASYGSDTLVGAMTHSRVGQPVCALMAVTAEVPHTHDDHPNEHMHNLALGMVPEDAVHRTDIAEDHTHFEASYTLACFRSIWGAPAHPSLWRCWQQWRLDACKLQGRIEIRSERDQQAPPPQVRLRFGRDRKLVARDGQAYTYGSWELVVARSDFPHATTRSAPACTPASALDATELILAATPQQRFERGQVFALELSIHLSSGDEADEAAR